MSALHRALLVFGIGALVYGSALLAGADDPRPIAHHTGSAG